MPADPRDYKLDVSGLREAERATSRARPQQARPWLSVFFRCCGVYQRIYRHRDGRRYEGNCPRCARKISFVVGEGGTGARQFIAE